MSKRQSALEGEGEVPHLNLSDLPFLSYIELRSELLQALSLFGEVKVIGLKFEPVRGFFMGDTVTLSNECQKSKDRIMCYSCDKYGHFSKDCLTPSRSKASATKSFKKPRKTSTLKEVIVPDEERQPSKELMKSKWSDPTSGNNTKIQNKDTSVMDGSSDISATELKQLRKESE
ncbi:hypothetical protein BD770DRAFT_410010 [Pilaira anomala]|nr:hypothetical protein BD770DRAFT_410010 [Pilaira anomala]